MVHNISRFFYDLANLILLINSSTESSTVSADLPANIEIITFIFLLINLKIFLVSLVLYTAVMFCLMF